jgi:hypothetical protein
LNENVDTRVNQAMRELQIRHAQGRQFVDDPDRAPTGSAYQQSQQQQQQHYTTTTANDLNIAVKDTTDNDDDEEDDEYWDSDQEDDPVWEAMRQKRLQEMQQAHQQKAQELALGHGQVRTIVEQEFLTECTGQSEWVVVHFYHNDYERCKVMDHHLQIIAPLHTSCKILRLDAAKAPFFVTKLQVRTLPTVMVFREGKSVARLIGFEGLTSPTKDPDAWKTSALQRWLAGAGAIQYKPSKDEEEEEEEINARRTNRVVHRGLVSTGLDDF